MGRKLVNISSSEEEEEDSVLVSASQERDEDDGEFVVPDSSSGSDSDDSDDSDDSNANEDSDDSDEEDNGESFLVDDDESSGEEEEDSRGAFPPESKFASPIARLTVSTQRKSVPGGLFCSLCRTAKHPDSFSAKQKKVARDDERYCLAHTGASGFNAKAVMKVKANLRDSDDELAPAVANEAWDEKREQQEYAKLRKAGFAVGTGNAKLGFTPSKPKPKALASDNEEEDELVVVLDDSEEEEYKGAAATASATKKKRRLVASDDDDEDEDKKEPAQARKKKRVVMADSSEEDEEDVLGFDFRKKG